MSEIEAEFGELNVHSVFMNKPELFERVLGVRIKEGTIIHHYSVYRKEIDFVLQDILENHYVLEVKVGFGPLDALSQVITYKKLYMKKNPKVRREKIIPVILVDSQNISKEDRAILGEHNVRLAEYDVVDIKSEYEKLKKEAKVLPPEVELPDISGLKQEVESILKFWENYSDLKILFEGFRKYHAFDDFWRWKRGEETAWWPNFIYKLQLQGKNEDALWVTFLEAITDDEDVAKGIYDDGWDWRKVASAPAEKFRQYLDDTKYRLTKIITIAGLSKGETIAGVCGEYLSKVREVGKSQVGYFLELIRDTKTQYDAYNRIVRDLKDIKGIGSWVARAFATWASVRKLLPISPTEKVRISGDVKTVVERMNLRKTGEKTEETILRIARKYGVAPELVERGLFRIEHG